MIERTKKNKILFVFGAGASHAEGAPLQKDILPFILEESSEIGETKLGRKVREFLSQYYAWDRDAQVYPSLETVFAFLDYLIYKNEGLGGLFTNEYIRDIRESLIKLIHYSVGKVALRRTGVYRQFWERVKRYNSHIAVFTTNYDTFLDEAFEALYPEHAYLDYCLHPMNHDYYENVYPFQWWINPESIAPMPGSSSSPRRIKLIKLHGSLHWKFCNCCNQVLLTPWETDVDLETEAPPRGSFPSSCDSKTYPCVCPHDGTPFQTLIVPPAHLKFLDHPTINTLINEAARQIRMAARVVFIGYSFPEADVHLKALFTKNLQREADVIVINRDCHLKIRKSYEALTKNVEFVGALFENIVKDTQTMKRLLEA